MKTIAVLALLILSGCSSFPNVACESWTHEGNYGPVTTHYDAKNVVRQEDGSLKIEQYTGAVKVLGGYGMTDTVRGLILTPKQAKEAEVKATDKEDPK